MILMKLYGVKGKTRTLWTARKKKLDQARTYAKSFIHRQNTYGFECEVEIHDPKESNKCLLIHLVKGHIKTHKRKVIDGEMIIK